MATLLGPFDVGYPVNFRSQGDTARDAFGKHIQEIERIYGLLNALDAGKATTDDVTIAITNAINNHKNETNPHPNWNPSLTFSNIIGTLDGSRISGSIPASLISGLLSNATISYGHVTGLADYIDDAISSIPSATDKGDGITSKSLGENGYVKFNNGFMIQWGTATSNSGQISFPTSFPNACWHVFATPYNVDRSGNQVYAINVFNLYKNEFNTHSSRIIRASGEEVGLVIESLAMTFHYLAIGN